MPRRALRPSFVVTFALGAAAIASGCGSSDGSRSQTATSPEGGFDSSVGDGPIADGGCPVQQPANGTPCDLPSSSTLGPGVCDYGSCVAALCPNGTWEVYNGCNPPAVYEAGPDGNAIPDGAGQDGGQIADAAGDVARDAG